jgi:hypothetical protein
MLVEKLSPLAPETKEEIIETEETKIPRIEEAMVTVLGNADGHTVVANAMIAIVLSRKPQTCCVMRDNACHPGLVTKQNKNGEMHLILPFGKQNMCTENLKTPLRIIGYTTLKAFNTAPLWTREELNIFLDAFFEAGVGYEVSSIPPDRALKSPA